MVPTCLHSLQLNVPPLHIWYSHPPSPTDVVHIHHLNHLSTNLPAIAKEFGAAVVFTLHGARLSHCPSCIEDGCCEHASRPGADAARRASLLASMPLTSQCPSRGSVAAVAQSAPTTRLNIYRVVSPRPSSPPPPPPPLPDFHLMCSRGTFIHYGLASCNELCTGYSATKCAEMCLDRFGTGAPRL